MIADIAFYANGIVTAEEMSDAGITRDERRGRIRKGLLIPEYPGVYRVGHRAPSALATYTAAVKAGGKGAVLAGLAAAWLLGLIRGEAPEPEVITKTPRNIDGLLTRCCRGLNPLETAEVQGVAVTTVPRTLVDLAAHLSAQELARVFHEAVVRYRVKPEWVEPLLRGRTGAAKLRAAMYGDAPVLLSRAEERLLELIDDALLPRPVTNKRVGNRYLDMHWPGLHVEVSSYRYHGSRHAWEQDQARRRAARKRDDRYLEFTATDVFERGHEVIADLREALTALGHAG